MLDSFAGNLLHGGMYYAYGMICVLSCLMDAGKLLYDVIRLKEMQGNRYKIVVKTI